MSPSVPLLRRVSQEQGDPDLFPEEVHQLHEAGKAQAARAALQKHIASGRDPERRDQQMAFAEDLYLWLEPMRGAPSMHTVNGIGTRLYGTHKPDGHGHYISILYVVVLFIPVFPLSAYVVQDADGGGWYFLARAPLPLFARAWRMAAAALAAVGIGSAAFATYQHGTHVDVLAWNGSPLPLQVSVGDEVQQVMPGRQATFDGVPAGPVPVSSAVIRGDGVVVVDEREADLSAYGGDEVVYNAGGLDLFEEGWVRYGPGEPPAGRLLGPGPILHATQDYVLRPSPSSLQVSDSKKYVDKSLFQPLGDGWSTSERLDVVGQQLGYEAVAAWAVDHVELAPDDVIPHTVAMYALAADPEQGRAFVDRLLTLHPGNVSAHRFTQSLRMMLGEEVGEIAADYRGRAEADPASVDLAYLHARMVSLQDAPAGKARFEAVLARDPGHPWAQRALAFDALEREDAALASRYFTSFAADQPERVVELLPLRLMVARVQHGKVWNDELDALIDEAAASGDNAFDLARRRMMHQARGSSMSLDGVLHTYLKAWAAAGGDPAGPVDRAYLRLLLARARGDAAALDDAVEAAEEHPSLAVQVAQAQLIGALSDGGDRRALGSALAVLDTVEELDGDTIVLFHAAVHLTDPEAAAAAVVAALANAPERSPLRVLEPALDRTDADAVSARIAQVEPAERGIAWAGIAVMLDAAGQADHPVAAEARARATVWGYPGNVPVWRD